MHTRLKCVHVDVDNDKFTVGKVYKRDRYGWTDTDKDSRVWTPADQKVHVAVYCKAITKDVNGKLKVDDQNRYATLIIIR